MEKPVVIVNVIIQNTSGRILLGRLISKRQDGGKYLWGLASREVAAGEALNECSQKCLQETVGLPSLSLEPVSVNTVIESGGHVVPIGVLARVRGEPANKQPGDWEGWQWFEQTALPEKLSPSAQKTIECLRGGIYSLDFER